MTGSEECTMRTVRLRHAAAPLASTFTADQRKLLLDLIDEWIIR
jgi:hypothetical protein